METQSETELTVGSLPPRPKRQPIPPGTYEAVYKGLGVFLNDSPWGKKKNVVLSFKITSGPHTDTVVTYQGSMLKLESGDYIIGDKGELAQRIMAITGGAKTLGEAHKGTRVVIGVVNGITGAQSKNPGTTYDKVTTVLRMPGNVPAAPAATTTAAARPPAATAAQPTQPQLPASAPKAGDNLLDDLADLSDFEEAGK